MIYLIIRAHAYRHADIQTYIHVLTCTCSGTPTHIHPCTERVHGLVCAQRNLSHFGRSLHGSQGLLHEHMQPSDGKSSYTQTASPLRHLKRRVPRLAARPSPGILQQGVAVRRYIWNSRSRSTPLTTLETSPASALSRQRRRLTSEELTRVWSATKAQLL